MKCRIGNLMMNEGNKLMHSTLFRISFLLLFAVNLMILFLFDHTDSFSKSYYRKFKLDYEQSNGTEASKLEQAKEECVKVQVMKVYADELNTADGIVVIPSSHDIAEKEGYSDEWYENVKKEYLSGYHVKYGTSLDKEAELLADVLKEIEQIEDYPSYLSSIQTQIKDSKSIKLFAENQSLFSKRNQNKTSADYKKMEKTTPSFAGTIGFSKILGNSRFDICPCLMLMMMAVLLFMEDKRSGVIKLYRSAGNGRGILFLVKSLLMLLFCFLTIILYWGSILVFVWTAYGKVPLQVPVQSILGYEACTIQASIGTYLLCYLIQKALVLFVLGTILNLFAILADHYAAFFFLSGILFALSFFCFQIIPKYTFLAGLRYFNFIYCMKAAPFFRDYLNFNLFGHPVGQYPIGIFLFGVIVLLFFIIGLSQYSQCEKLFRNDRIQIGTGMWKKKKRAPVCLFRHEVYKMLLGNKILFILIGIMAVLWYSTLKQPVYLTEDEYYYQYYMEHLEGKPTEAKRDYIEKEANRIADVEKQIQSVQQSFAQGKIGKAVMNELVGRLELQIKGLRAFQRIQERLSYIDSHQQNHYAFVYEDGWNQLLGLNEEGQSNDIKNGLLCVIAITISLSGLFGNDWETGICHLQRAAKKGRKSLIRSKILLSVTTILIIMGIVYTPEFILVNNVYGIHSVFEKAGSIPALASVLGSGGTLLAYCFVLFLTRFIGYVVLLAFLFGISHLTKNTLKTILFTLLLFAVPLMINLFGLHNIDSFTFNALLSGNEILQFLGK